MSLQIPVFIRIDNGAVGLCRIQAKFFSLYSIIVDVLSTVLFIKNSVLVVVECSVLPRLLLQGAAPCPLFVTPCPFEKAEMTPCPFD